jgi:hypothetical protein
MIYKNVIKIFFSFLINLFGISSHQQPTDKPPPLPPRAPRIVQSPNSSSEHIIESQALECYKLLCLAYKNNQIKNFKEFLPTLEQSIYLPLKSEFTGKEIKTDNYNYELLHSNLKSIINDIYKSEDNFFRINLGDSLKHLNRRISLIRIDKNVAEGNGVRGSFNHHKLSKKAQKALRSLTGRIFQLKFEVNEKFQARWELITTSSATLAHYNNFGDTILTKLPPLKENTELNCVITCAHGLQNTNEEGTPYYRTEIYFVPSSQLDEISGFPTNTSSEESLINYLRTNSNSFRIINVHMQNRFIEKNKDFSINNKFFEINMIMAQPQYMDEREDCVVAEIKSHENQKLPTYLGDIKVNFFKNTEFEKLSEGQLFFSVGYPACDQYGLIFNNHYHHNLINKKWIYPIFITSDNTEKPTLDNGRIIFNNMPFATGMSGGGLFYEHNNELNFFGCIASTSEALGINLGSYLL